MAKTERKSPEPKLPFEIVSYDELQKAYPALVTEEEVHRTTFKGGEKQSEETTRLKFVAKEDKPLLYQLVKLNHKMNQPTPGISVIVATDGEEKQEEHNGGPVQAGGE